MDQDNIKNELRDLNSELPANSSQPLFSVPEGYFDGLAARILEKVKKEENGVTDELSALSPFLAGLSKENVYHLPEGYFDENMAALSFLVKEDASNLLNAIGKELPYTVPKNYFDQLPDQLMANLTRPKAKVVPFFSRTWMKVAAAAVIGGIICVGGYQLLNNDASNQPSTANAYKPADTANDLVAKNKASVANDIKNVSTKELDEFIGTVPYNPAKLQKKNQTSVTGNDVEVFLKDISENEMDAFLDQLPTADADLFVID